jgi:hypothetical protein
MLLRKAEMDPIQVLPQVSLEINEDLTLEVHPIHILDRGEKELKNGRIPMAKILRKSS